MALHLGGGESGSKEFAKELAWAPLLAGEIKQSPGAAFECGSTKKMEATIGRSVVWQRDMEQHIKAPIPWPQSMWWPSAGGVF